MNAAGAPLEPLAVEAPGVAVVFEYSLRHYTLYGLVREQHEQQDDEM
jgi:hypothetical protein